MVACLLGVMRCRTPLWSEIDRMFVSFCWNSTFPRAALQALLSRCSDHAPLLLLLDDGFHPKRRFRFQAF
jgi:endonuclease/exonuclease/phosphatase family metal-dependent hydrolase